MSGRRWVINEVGLGVSGNLCRHLHQELACQMDKLQGLKASPVPDATRTGKAQKPAPS